MASTHYVGQTPSINELLGEGQPRYFYALKRTEDGTLFFAKIDQLKMLIHLQLTIQVRQ